MYKTRPTLPSPLLFIFFLVLVTTPPCISISLSQFQTLTSLAHSLITRVANLRASRGDVAGSERARAIAHKIERGLGLGFWGLMCSMGWDYLKNYAWRDMSTFELFGSVSDMNELLKSVGELTRMESESERAVWIRTNYQRVFRISKSLFSRLLQVFHRSGAMKEVVEIIQREVLDGGLLRDCLEVSNNDFKGLLQVLKDITLQFASSNTREDRHDL